MNCGTVTAMECYLAIQKSTTHKHKDKSQKYFVAESPEDDGVEEECTFQQFLNTLAPDLQRKKTASH